MKRLIESILAKTIKICAEMYYRLGHRTLIALSLNTKYDDHDFTLKVNRYEVAE